MSEEDIEGRTLELEESRSRMWLARTVAGQESELARVRREVEQLRRELFGVKHRIGLMLAPLLPGQRPITKAELLEGCKAVHSRLEALAAPDAGRTP